jgi:alkylated DNA repair protein alkB family protein 6
MPIPTVHIAMTSTASSVMESHRISEVPTAIYYVPEFLPPSVCDSLLAHIHARPWIQLSKRRLQVYPAQLTAKNVLLSKDPIPSWLVDAVDGRFRELGVFSDDDGGEIKMNHILVNNYRPGEGIMPHEDGPAYHPITATVSLGSHTVLDVTAKSFDDRPRRWRILQEPGSLLVTRGEAYVQTRHGIEEVEEDHSLSPDTVANWDLLGNPQEYQEGTKRRGERTSLTCRSVIKVSKLGGKLFGR